MKILFINDYGYEVGGAEKIIISLKSEYKKQGHIVKILSGDEKSPNKNDKSFNDYSFKSFSATSLSRYLFFIYNPFSFFALRKALQDFKPDIVHIHNMQKASASILFLLKNYPVVMTVHDLTCIDQTAFEKINALHDFKNELSNYFIYKKNITYWVQHLKFKLIRRGQMNINTMISPSNAMKVVLEQAAVPTNVKVIYNGIPSITPAYKKYNPKQPRILFVGRIIEGKGIFTLINAFELVLKKSRNTKLDVIGTGEALAASKKLAKKLQIEKNINFIGSKQNGLIHNYYARNDLVIVPSLYYDNLPTVAIEAMMAAKALVVTRAGGLNELVQQGVNGLKVQAGSEKELANAIIKILSNHNLPERMGKESFKISEVFRLEVFSESMLAVYQELA